MIVGYIILMGIVLFSLLVCAAFAGKQGNELGKSIKKLIVVGMICVASNMAYILTKDEVLATIFFGVFSVLVDWMLVYLYHYTYLYTENENPNIIRMILIRGMVILDTISFILNNFFHHLFTFKGKITKEEFQIYMVDTESFFMYLHYGICYIIVVQVVYLLVKKILTTSRFYRKKYYNILIYFGVVMLNDGICTAFHFSLNYSILFYGALAVAVCYYSLYYEPKELKLNMLSLVAEKSTSGVLCFSSDGKCIYTNDKAWELVGVEKDIGLLERTYKQQEWVEQRKNKDSFTHDMVKKVDGELRHLEIMCQNMYDEKQVYVGCYFNIVDNTQRVLGYEKQIEEARQASKTKSDFLSKISHEIRTPVNSIYGMNEMILREAGQPEILEYADKIKGSTEILLNIINDVLDFSKIESGKMTIVPVEYNMREFLENTIGTVAQRAKNKGLELNTEFDTNLPTLLEGDNVRIQQVVVNLLTNAIKYTSQGSVTIRLRCERYGEIAYLTWEVEDTGIGIRQEDIPKLFTAFERLEEMKNHSIQGTGLGLNITRMLLNLMDSNLHVKSEYGKGSVFSFRILQRIVDDTPMNFYEKVEKKREEYKELFQAPDMKVMVVDDNDVNRMVFCQLLKRTKIQIEAVDSGEKCLESIQKEHYDLIFMDYMMPGMDGVETLHLMQNTEHQCKNTPVIMLTANALVGNKDIYLKEGFDGFLAKPIRPEELESMIFDYILQQGIPYIGNPCTRADSLGNHKICK